VRLQVAAIQGRVYCMQSTGDVSWTVCHLHRWTELQWRWFCSRDPI